MSEQWLSYADQVARLVEANPLPAAGITSPARYGETPTNLLI